MSDRTVSPPGPAATDELAERIAAAGLALSQTAAELREAAERLRAAEKQAAEMQTRALEAEGKTRDAEEGLAASVTRISELMELLDRTREQQSEADERSRQAEQRLHVAIERTRLMQEQIEELEERLGRADAEGPGPVAADGERESLQQAVAAEVRRPLTAILGLTLAIKHHDPSSNDGREMIRQLATNARKLDRLVTELVEIDRLVDGSLVPNRRRTDIQALVRRVVDETPDLANRNVTVDAERALASVDPALAEQIVETLLANAGRRTASGEPVSVKVSSNPDGVVISVDDSGPEVPPGLRQALSAALQEGAGTKQHPKGATGLSLLSRLAEIHGGRAWVEERPSGGASFRVFLPDVLEDANGAVSEERGAAALVPEEAPGEPVITI